MTKAQAEKAVVRAAMRWYRIKEKCLSDGGNKLIFWGALTSSNTMLSNCCARLARLSRKKGKR